MQKIIFIRKFPLICILLSNVFSKKKNTQHFSALHIFRAHQTKTERNFFSSSIYIDFLCFFFSGCFFFGIPAFKRFPLFVVMKHVVSHSFFVYFYFRTVLKMRMILFYVYIYAGRSEQARVEERKFLCCSSYSP